MKKQIIASGALAISFFLIAATPVFAEFGPPPVPTDPDQCKHDGWRDYGDMFKNQGDCVSFVVTDGRNQPDGPPIN